MAEGFEQVESWSGLGTGTDRESFLEKIRENIDEIDAAEAAEAVFCVLTNRLSGGTADRLLDELPPDVRDLLSICPRRQSSAHASHTDKDDFYLSVAEHLLVDPEDVRRIIHAVFGALHTQIVEREAERIASELPDDIKQTWIAARHAVPAPH